MSQQQVDIDTMPAGFEMDALIATVVMGWEWVDIDHIIINDPNDVFYRTHPDIASLVPFPDGKRLGTPSHVKWHDVLERQGIKELGYYWIDPQTKRIREVGAWSPSTGRLHCRQMEDRIEALGLLSRYVAHLAHDLGGAFESAEDCTPDERCRAAYKAVTGVDLPPALPQ